MHPVLPFGPRAVAPHATRARSIVASYRGANSRTPPQVASESSTKHVDDYAAGRLLTMEKRHVGARDFPGNDNSRSTKLAPRDSGTAGDEPVDSQ